ncbi:MAG TPA: O-antigen ligase family protein, partial [Solirubrobacteraceae bacterium]
LLALGVLAVATGAAWTTLNAVHDSAPLTTGLPTAAATHDAALVILIGTIVVAATWAALQPLAAAASASPAFARRPQRALVAAALASITLIAGAALVAGPAGSAVQDRWDSFRSLEQLPPGSRLTSGGGNRYDYWRIALNQFRAEPLRGVGAGNYTTTYFRERRTNEDIRQPHSLELQTLAETGLLGGVALALALAAVLAAVARARSGALRPGTDRLLAVGCVGILGYWVMHASVDWLHLLPGVTGCALAALAVMVGQAQWPDRTPRLGARASGRALAFAAGAIATAMLAVGWLADDHLRAARSALPDDPRAALGEARSALRLDSHSVDALVIIAAARAREDDYAGARAALLRAAELEPSNFIPPTLLGDLASRRGDRAVARRAYSQALRLNPRDPQLRALVAQPR